jgi:hypothetical protein
LASGCSDSCKEFARQRNRSSRGATASRRPYSETPSPVGETKEHNRRLKSLLEDFANPKLDLRPSRIGNNDVIGDVYEYLIGHFASDAGKKGGEFYTPAEVATLLAKLLQPKPGNTICDPACGSGSLLIREPAITTIAWTSKRSRHLRDCAAVRRQLGMTRRCWLELLTFWRTN